MWLFIQCTPPFKPRGLYLKPGLGKAWAGGASLRLQVEAAPIYRDPSDDRCLVRLTVGKGGGGRQLDGDGEEGGEELRGIAV